MGLSGKSRLTFLATFDERVAYSLAALASSVLDIPIWAFLNMCSEAKANKKHWRAIRDRHKQLLPWYNSMRFVDDRYQRLMEETEQRILQGDNPEEIVKEVTARIEAEITDSDPVRLPS